jgi:hypothetical protein
MTTVQTLIAEDRMIDQAKRIAQSGALSQGALLAGGSGSLASDPRLYDDWSETALRDTAPGSVRAPRANPPLDSDDVERGLQKLERICGN